MSKIFFTHIYVKTIFPVKYWSQLLPDKKITKRIRDKNTKNAILPLFWAYIGQPDNHELEISVFCLFLSWPLFWFIPTQIGWQTFCGHNRWHLVDNRGDISWTLLATSHGQKCPQDVLFLGDFSWTFFGWHFVDIFGWILENNYQAIN